MSKELSSFEGKIVILSYTECDYEGEGTACLVYKICDSKLKPLLGVLDLPDGVFWNHNNKQYEKALKIIQELEVKEVYTPLYSTEEIFFGNLLGYEDLTSELNDQGEIECWCELGAFMFSWEMLRLLRDAKINVMEVNPKTMEVTQMNW